MLNKIELFTTLLSIIALAVVLLAPVFIFWSVVAHFVIKFW